MASGIAVWLAQIFRFGLVGILSTLVHVAVLVIGVEVFFLATQLANVIAFVIALSIGFALNRAITFAGHAHRELGAQYVRYFAVALVGYFLNSLTLFIVEDVFHQSYLWSLLVMVFIVPLIVFYLLRRFVFFSSLPRQRETN